MPLDIDHPLGNLTQVIHLDHLKPPVKLLLRSTCSWRERKPWAVKLFGMFPRPRRRDHRLVIWECQMSAAEGVGSLGACKQGPEMRRRQKQEAIIDAINSGMLHIDLGGEEVLLDYLEENQAEVQQLHFLDADGQAIIKLPIRPLDMEEAHVSEAVELLETCFELLARPAPVKADKAEIRSLHAEIAKKDEEISHLQTKLASLKATVVRATASDNNRKKVQASPKKPANASALQPNAKRRKAVEDEFAGSDSE